MDGESSRKFERRGRGLFWVTFALVVLLSLAACNGQAASPVQPTATQPVGLTPATSSSPTAATPVPAQLQSLPTQTANPAIAAAPVCASPATLTPAVTEGPFFKVGSPERSSLLDANIVGTKLDLTGYVLTADCKPVGHALLDFWQADSKGNYDNSGYTLRGHQFTDAAGRFQLTTIVPGLYPGRTEHIHVKAQAPNGPILTTQLFFPGVADNSSDGIFDPKLLMNVNETGSGLEATFNFVVSN
jgi:protocatechuate 3,4-dioxygenase beta subunit